MAEAAGITFYTLLALFPALAALVSIYGLFADPATISDHLSALSQVVPGGGMQIITDQIKSLTSNGNKALGFAAVLGIGTSLWSANQAIKALFDALNVVYDEREKRGFMLRTAITLAFTIGGILFVLVALAAVVAVPVVLNTIGLGGVRRRSASPPAMAGAADRLAAYLRASTASGRAGNGRAGVGSPGAAASRRSPG